MDNTTHSYEEWKAELIRVAVEETGQTGIKINDNEARQWYDSGWNPYYTFRENCGNECDA